MLLALVAAATIGGAGLLAGLEALVSSVTLIADGLTDPDWDELHCTVGWSLAYKQNFTNIMHDLLTWGGFTFPYTLALAHNDILYAQSDRTAIVLPDAALATVRSLGPDSRYPASKWAATSSNWANYPTESREENAAIAYPCNPTWPFHFVDGWQPTAPPVPPPGAPPGPVAGAPIPVNGLFSLPGRPPLVRDSVEFALRQSQLNFPLAGVHFFGNAVEVGRELIVNVTSNESWDMDPDFLNWDLDGDPGIEFPTWVEPSPSSPRTASTPEP